MTGDAPLYYLKTDAKRIELVLWFLAEGVDVSVLVRFTGHADATLARWLERMGRHSQGWHNFLFRNLALTLVQMDELYTLWGILKPSELDSLPNTATMPRRV